MGEKMIELCNTCHALERCRPITHGWIENRYSHLAACFSDDFIDDCNNDME
ncbi:MAG TPA: hypothetical protein VFD03_10565 [Clostridia bacterium]|nr:hypothetical protein [Clostridia bacterium]